MGKIWTDLINETIGRFDKDLWDGFIDGTGEGFKRTYQTKLQKISKGPIICIRIRLLKKKPPALPRLKYTGPLFVCEDLLALPCRNTGSARPTLDLKTAPEKSVSGRVFSRPGG